MQPQINVILTVPPTDLQHARTLGVPLGHMAYRISSETRLLRTGLPVTLRGGLMVMDDADAGEKGDPSMLAEDVLRECNARGFTGILCDFEGRPSPHRQAIIQALDGLAERQRWTLYVPEAYGDTSVHAKVLISSAVSGGFLSRRLSNAVDRWQGRAALAVERVCADFSLPDPTGCGKPLTHAELKAQLDRRSPSIFFSPELCARYFTYMCQDTGAHFVLFDDGESIRKKLSSARAAGFTSAIMAYPQIRDLLPGVLN